MALKDLLTIILGGGLFSALVSKLVEFFLDRKKRMEGVKYLALRLAFLFEGYAIDCASKISDHQLYFGSRGAAGGTMAEIPKPLGLPESGSYEFLKLETLNRVFAFPQSCHMAQEVVSSVGDLQGEDDFHEALERNTIKVASEAVEIGRKIRRDHGLVERRLEYGEWDIDKFLDGELEKLKAADRR